MFTINEDKSIYVTRGDVVFFSVTAEEDGKNHKFQPGDVVRIKVYGKKDAENVVLQKDFPVLEYTERVEVYLSEADTKFGNVISKPTDYWYEVELNPGDNPQTIIGYDEDGAKIFKLFPEGDDIPPFQPEPEEIPVVDAELDPTSDRPVQNKAIASELIKLRDECGRTRDAVVEYHATPQMYGAIGDGEADDTDAIQDAINALSEKGGGTLVVPTGNYNVSQGEIVVKSNIKIVGIGYPKLIAKSKIGYFSIFTNNKANLENVEISGLIFDQWGELGVQPDNTSIPCCCIAFLGKCENITVTNNLFYSIGGWTIAVTDTEDNYGSKNTYITNNRINWKQAGDGTWYDASAIYAESDSHVIEHNFIESFIGERAASSRWKSEGGIETHGIGVVRWTEIHNVQAGINVVEHAYDRTTELKAKREIAYNIMRGVCRGLWFWIPKTPYGIENVEIYCNDIEVVAEGYYVGYGAICCTLTEKAYTDTTNNYNGYLKGVKVYNNRFHFVDNTYSGSEYLDAKNVGAISFGASGIVSDVEIYNNEIDGFPWPAVATYQWDADASRFFSGFNIYNNTVIDCGYRMSNEYQNSVFLMYHADKVYIHDNAVKWVNQNTTKYLIGGGATGCDVLEYVNNKQVSENGFTTYGTLVSSTDRERVGIIIDLYNLGYRTNNGSPVGVLTPKKIGERVFDSTYKRWFVAVGETNTSWRAEASKEKGVATMPSGTKELSVYHNLVYVPTNVQITPLGYVGNAYISFLSSDRFIISCTEAPASEVKICWEAEV